MKQSRKTSKQPVKLNEKRPTIGARLQPETYEKVVQAASANRISISAEIERRIEESFGTGQPDPALQDLGHRVMAAFEAGGQRASRNMTADGRRELPAREWIEDPSSYTEAASRALETLVDWHPKPLYGHCLLLIYALRARLDQAWLALLNDEEDEEARRKMIEHADAIARQLIPPPSPPSLLDPLPPPVEQKDES